MSGPTTPQKSDDFVRKRPRREEDTSANVPDHSHLIKDEQLWLEGGDVVLKAGNFAFKVYRGMLARRSRALRDLLYPPVKTEYPAGTFDGLPLVSVSDSASDIRYFLLVLCCGKNYYTLHDVHIPVDFDVLSALIRMAHKYAIPDVLDDALSRLKQQYTTDMKLWRYMQHGKSRTLVHCSKADHLAVINLARLTDTPSLLPTAFLACATTLGAEVLRAVDAPGPFGISSEDALRIIEGKAALARESGKHALSAIPALAGCTHVSKAGSSTQAPRSALASFMGEDGGFSQGSASQFVHRQPFDARSAMIPKDAAGELAICPRCKNTLLVRMENAMLSTWADLPKIFGLKVEGWPTS